MSSTGADPTNDAWIEVQFSHTTDPAIQSGNRQAMEKLLIDAQRESGQSSLAQSGSSSPAIVGSRSPQVLVDPSGVAAAAGEPSSLQSSGGDWQRDWPARPVSQQPGWQKCQTWRFLSLRKTGLMRRQGGGGGGGCCSRWSGSLLLGLLSHAASFLLGAASMYIVIRSVGSQQRQW